MSQKCMYCHSTNVSPVAMKKGFSGGKAVGGFLLAGPVGVLAGTHRQNQVDVHIMCQDCLKTFTPRDVQRKQESLRVKQPVKLPVFIKLPFASFVGGTFISVGLSQLPFLKFAPTLVTVLPLTFFTLLLLGGESKASKGISIVFIGLILSVVIKSYL